MDFPPGRAILVLLLLAIATAIPVFLRKHAASADLTIWTFDRDGVNASAIDAFQQSTGKSVAVKLISTRALDTRLLSQFMSAGDAIDSPDLVEIEIGSIGKFFRPPAEQIGLRPLNVDLVRSGLQSKLLPARLVPWTKDELIFGLPQDVHPVSLTYRKDLFDLAGVDPSACTTWLQLQRAAERFEQFWRAHGQPDRRAMMLSATAADDLIVMLQQRHVDLLDASGGVHLAEPTVARTVLLYASLVAGNHAVAGQASPGEGRWAQDLERGELCMLFTPDWRASELKSLAPNLAGKLMMMPLPHFDPQDAPTGSWGGTMIGLPRGGRHPAEAWALAEALTLHPPTNVLPPLPERWNDSEFHQPDPFFAGNQSIGDLYVKLAGQLPPRAVAPFSALADTELAEVLRQAIDLQRDHPERPADDPQSVELCMRWLATAADDLRARIRVGTF